MQTMSPPLLVLLLTVLAFHECVYIYSSFWAPLFDRRILNYRVDVPFDPNAGQSARVHYASKYGYRGEKLIAALGNGAGPGQYTNTNKVYGDVKFFYT